MEKRKKRREGGKKRKRKRKGKGKESSYTRMPTNKNRRSNTIRKSPVRQESPTDAKTMGESSMRHRIFALSLSISP